ncbi:MAG: hypothetical protein ABIE43_04055 [Patescibacteria group bacterium]
MMLNKSIIEILNHLHSLGIEEINKRLEVNDNLLTINSGDQILATIKLDSINLFDSVNLQNKLKVLNKFNEETIDILNLKKFFNKISDSIIRLNHIGISYYCDNIDQELEKLKNKLKDTIFNIYEEKSGLDNQRWFFVGDNEKWQEPLFEIVLTKIENNENKEWIPHFQIDIDTNLDFYELEEICKKFNMQFDWVLDIAGFGKVLGMKILGNIKGVKLCLGLGPKNRGVKWHREKEMKNV